jgi:hypothetical protein
LKQGNRPRKKRYIVNWRLQGTLILCSVLILCIGFGYLYIAANRILDLLSDPSSSVNLPPFSSSFYPYLEELRGYFNRVFFSVVGVTSAAISITMLIFSNRMTRFLSEASENQGKELEELRLRKGDFFQELAQAINKLLKKD